MANYFLNDDGSLTKKNKKKKGNNYILGDDGKITLNQSDFNDTAPVKTDVSSIDELKAREKELDSQLIQLQKTGKKNEWWSDDRNFFENVINVPYKLFVEQNELVGEDLKKHKKLNKELAKVQDQIKNYQVENTELSALDKISYTISGGIKSGFEGIASTIGKGTATILGQDVSDVVVPESYEEKLSKKARQETDGVAGFGLDVVGGISRQLPNMVTGSGAVNTLLAAANFGGGAYNEAKRMGVSEDRATVYGLTVGGLETVLNKILPSYNIGGKNVFGKTATDGMFKKIMGKVTSNAFLRNTLTSGAGEFTEEYLQEFLDPIIRESILEEDNEVGILGSNNAGDIAKNLAEYTAKNFFSKENAYAGLLGFVTSGVMGAQSNIDAYRYEKTTGRSIETGLTANEQSVLDNVTTQRKTELQKERALNTEIDRQIKEFESTFGKMTEAEKNGIRNKVKEQLESGEIDYNTSKLSKKEIAKIEKEVREDLEKGYIDIDTIEGTLSSEKTAQIKQLQEELANTKDDTKKAEIQAKINELQSAKASELQSMLGKDTYLQKSYREANLQKEKFFYEPTGYESEYKRSLARDFEKVANNTTKSHETFEMLSKIAEDKQTNYGVINNEQLKQLGYDIEGKDVNGLVRVNEDGTQKVLINIDSNKALNRIVGHETTHLLEGTKEYTELQQMVKEYAETKGDYNRIHKELTKLYDGIDADIEAEITSELVGDYLFTDTDFINNLSTKKPTIFQKIYNEIKHLYKLATAGSKEARQLEKVKKAFDKAYKQNAAQTDADTKYSILDNKQKFYANGDVGGKKYKHGYHYDIKNGGRADNVMVTVTKDGYVANNALLSDEIKGKGEGTKIMLDLNQQSLKETGKPLQSLPEYNKVGLKNHTEEGKGLWESLVRKGYAVKNADNSYSMLETAPTEAEYIKQYDTKYSVTDNKGRTLTKEQQEFFKDSKVRDSEGRLLEVYHGTNEDFTVFDKSYIGNASGDLGFLGDGFYFATHSGEASYYGGKNMVVYLNVTNPYNIKNLQKYKGVFLRGENSNPYLEIKNLVDMNQEWGNIEIKYGNTYGDVAREVTKLIDNIKVEEAGRTADGYKQFRTEVNGKINFVSTIDSYTANEVLGDTLNKEMRDIFGYIPSSEVLQNITSEVQIRKLNNQEPIKTFSEVLQEQGYDGIFQGDTASYTDEIVVFNPNQIKNVDNTNPTSDADIRYSLSKKTQRAIDTMGTTTNMKVAGYLTTDGQFIDFSGKHQGARGDSRQMDHREISDIYTDEEYDAAENKYSNMGTATAIMQDFIDEGNIRTTGTGVDISIEPTKAQYDKLYSYLEYVQRDNGEVFIDLESETKNRENLEYDGKTSISKMINDIKNHYAKYSLSNQGEAIAPSRNDIFGTDIKLQIEEAIAPLQEEIAELKEALDPEYESTVDYSPLTEEDIPMVEQQGEEAFRNIDETDAPMEIEENIPVVEDEITTTRSLEDVRNFDEVGSRKIKAYQYENPEVRPYFQEMAQYMLGDLENSIKGERGYNDQLYYDTNGEQGFYGTTRQTTDDIAELLDSKYKYTYKDIRKGLEAIIEDHGAENIAVAKRIELALDKRLREGYTDVSGYEIPANQDYIKLLQDKEIIDYFSSIPIGEAPVENVDIPVNNASNTKNKSEIAPVRRNIDWDSIEDTSQGNQIAINEEGETVEIINELEKKKQRAYKKLGSKEDYISNQAYELYDEVKNLKKGVKASYELGRVLDVAFANINALTEGMTETKAKEVRNKIWRDVTTSLLNVKAKPLTTVNKDSTIEAVIRQNIGREYDSKKNEIANMKEEDLVTKTKKELRKELLIDENDFFINALDNAKNRSMALMNNTDTIRNTELVFGRENAKIINEKIFQKEIDNEADSIAWQNKERQEIKDLGIKARSKESAAVQKYGEKQYLNELEELVPYGDKELASEFPDVETQNKIKNAAKVIRSKYDNYIDEANNVLTKLGFEPIKKRNDYMRHFQELNDVFSRHGIPFNAQNMQEHVLPTDINGLTEFWSPQKNYFANMQARKGLKTTYDAITGVDGYIGGIANLIYHTEDIQRGRAFEELIRETYGEDKGFENLENLPEELQQARIEKIQDNHLSNYAAWVHEWTNNVAGKKSKIDRSVESMFGRKAFSFLDTARKQVGSNMIGFNLSSSLTNLIAPVQAASKTNKLAVLKGTADTIKNMFIKDNFMDKNKFLTSRMGTDMISKNTWQKVQDAGFIFMKGMDWFSSNQIVRSKYYELRANGMSEEQAHAEAGKFAARILGDRTKGANAQLYNSKLIGLVTQFQLEVNNQLYSQFYDTYHESKENAKGDALKTAAGMTFTLGQLFAFTHLFGQTFEAIAGYNPTFDVIEMLKTAFGWDDDDEEKTAGERWKDAADRLVDALPYVNILTGGGRIPVASGLPNLVGVATGGKDQYGNELTFEDEMKKLLYLIPPTGGNQFKKTTQGLGMFDEDLPIKGSYTDSGNLRFPVEDTLGNRVQAALFGQYANENARYYFDNELAPLKEKQIEEFKEMDIPYKEYREYRKELSDVNKTKADKDSSGKPISGTAAGKKAYSIMNGNYSKKEKERLLKGLSSETYTITTSDLNKLNNNEELYKYYFSLSTKGKSDFINAINNYGFDAETLYEVNTVIKNVEDNYSKLNDSGRNLSQQKKQQIKDVISQYTTTSAQYNYLYHKIYKK